MTNWTPTTTRLPKPLRDVPILIEEQGELVEDMGFMTDDGTWYLSGTQVVVVCPFYWFDLPPIPKHRSLTTRPVQPAVMEHNTGSCSSFDPRSIPPTSDAAPQASRSPSPLATGGTDAPGGHLEIIEVRLNA